MPRFSEAAFVSMVFRHLAVLVGALLAGAPGLAGEVPPRTEAGQALIVPAEHLEVGEVYHATPGVGVQVVWESDAPLMRVVAMCDRVVGYVVTPFDIEEGDVPLIGGAFRIPVASLSFGKQDLDNEFHGSAALNAAEHPEMTLLITGVRDAKFVGDNEDLRSREFELVIAGQLTAKDKTVDIEIPTRMTMVPFTWKTMQFNMGDFIVLRGDFEVDHADLGLDISAKRQAGMASETARVSLYLLCSTVSPEKRFDPRVEEQHHQKQLRFLTLLRDFNEPAKAYAFGRDYARETWDNGRALNNLAWATLVEEGIRRRDLAFVAELAERANQLTDGKDPQILNTLARLHYERCDLDKAIEFARKATENLEDVPQYEAAPIRQALSRYEAEVGEGGE